MGVPKLLQPPGYDERPSVLSPGCAEEDLRVLDKLRHRHIEIPTNGIDEELQGITGDPYGGLSSVGLRVPFLATPLAGVAAGAGGQNLRYLFMLAAFHVGQGARARIKGFRQLFTLGAKTTVTSGGATRVFEQLVTSPFFKLPTANVSWHLRIIDEGQIPVPRLLGDATKFNVRNLAFRMSKAPALLYETATTPTPFYVNLAAYTPPNLGRPWGVPVNANWGTFYDLRTDWKTHGAWTSLDIPVDGEATIAFFASVRQGVSELTAPAFSTFFGGGLSPEEQFIANFAPANMPSGTTSTGAMPWRVGGDLIVELDR